MYSYASLSPHSKLNVMLAKAISVSMLFRYLTLEISHCLLLLTALFLLTTMLSVTYLQNLLGLLPVIRLFLYFPYLEPVPLFWIQNH